MSDFDLLLEYDGGDADTHLIDMRLLGESFQGIDRIISDMIIVTSARRLPKRGERAPLIVKAHEPKSGSVSVPAVLQESAGLLQLGWQVFGPSVKDIMSQWIKAVFLFHSGKKGDATIAIEKVTELALAHNAALSAVDERRHSEMIGLQAIVQMAIERLGPAATQSVAPVGPSVRRLWVSWAGQRQLAADEPIANEIRKTGELEYGPIETFTLKTDGFTFHTRKLSVEHPERTGFILAEVEDPIAGIENNPYARAVQTKARINVQAKAGYRNGSIERLVVMDFISQIDDAA